jgi:type IV secretion system protein TrbG
MTLSNSRAFRCNALRSLLIISTIISGSTAYAKRPPRVNLENAVQAQALPEAPKPVEVIAIAVPLPLPGQLKPVSRRVPPRSPARAAGRSHLADPRARVGAANEAARVEPYAQGFINAIQQYPYADGALYQVYASPGQVTDIALQEGEQLVGAGPVAAGDTVRWIIGDTTSGSGASSRVHILVKPTRADLVTNLVINTDKRTYHLELRGNPSTYMASVSWIYPQDQLIALRGSNSAAVSSTPVASGIDVAALNFSYRIDGDNPPWRPVRIFDDGRQVFIEFPETIVQGEMPPLFVIGAGGEGELVNYRVSGHHLIVDRLFAAAELRLGDKHSVQKVRIMRAGAKVRR